MEKFHNLGEISLAHLGVLYLDEFLEFKSSVLDLMRSPLESGVITLNRVFGNISYPCNFMLVASMNPCPCGYYGSKLRECTCSFEQVTKYQNRCSGPLLDRIDIQVEVSNISYETLKETRKAESSAQIKERVTKARLLQKSRYKEDNIYTNSQLTPSLIVKYCKLDSSCEKLLSSTFQRLNLTARAYNRILKLARTIADLDESENIEMKHLAEAIQYRSLDKKYWRSSYVSKSRNR